MGDKEDYLTSYRLFFENFAANVNPEDQLPVYVPDYSITEAELPGDVIYWCIEYLREKSCPATLMTPLLRIVLDEVRIAAKKYPNKFGFIPDNSAYKAILLMQAVIARVNDVCLRYLDNSHLDTLPPPPPPKQKEFRTVSAAMRNSRRAMEDRHVEIGNLEALFGIETTEHTSFYAVYDGHAGSSAAQYCAAHLHQYLVESPHFKKNLKKALHDAFMRTDAEFVQKSKMEHRVVGGSTAVVVCVRGSRLYVSWAGDSLALVAQRMRVMQLVNPHKPGREDERRRIESSGGHVMHWGTWRVNGQLAVSRAIGDTQYKPFVTAMPEMAALDLDGDEDFLVVACDGLWDVVTEDEVALSVYRQIAADPDDLKAVAKGLVSQAKRQGSEDNISIIVVFLKEPRDIAAQNRPPMDLGLDNAVVNPPPFAIDGDACKMAGTISEAAGGDAADNGVSDSDSEDLGPETAVDIDADDGDVEMRNHEPAPPTPPAHTVEESHIDGNLVDNVAESGEESEDEWNYYKGEGEPELNPTEEVDELQRSETPCQDNSAWESSSVDMNSSPLNPDAPVFVPGGITGPDVLLAQSPRKPQPMEDIEVPDVKQFQTEAVERPADLQFLDNNGSTEGVTLHLNHFDVDPVNDKEKDTSLIEDFERIQKDTTDFCDIQVFQANNEMNPFDMAENNALFERLKNKERDPMSMSFYQEKDDDTCERITNKVDLNSVQLLPDFPDTEEDIQTNGETQNFVEEDKENINPEEQSDLVSPITNGDEPNNDIVRLDDRSDINNYAAFDNTIQSNVESNNMHNYLNTDFDSNIQQENVIPTDTPESHKLLFEQIPEIPDGKSSELSFNDDLLDPSESEKDVRVITPQDDISQEDEIDCKPEELQSETIENDGKLSEDAILKFENNDTDNEIVPESLSNNQFSNPAPTAPEISEIADCNPFTIEGFDNNITVDVHQSESQLNEFEKDTKDVCEKEFEDKDEGFDAPKISIEGEENELSTHPTDILSQSPQPETENQDEVQIKSPLPTEVLSDRQFAESPVPSECSLQSHSPMPPHSPMPSEVKPPVPAEVPLPRESPAPSESPIPDERVCQQSPLLEDPVEKENPTEEAVPSECPKLIEEKDRVPHHKEELLVESHALEQEIVKEVTADTHVPQESSLPEVEDLIPTELHSDELSGKDASLLEQEATVESSVPIDDLVSKSPVPNVELVTNNAVDDENIAMAEQIPPSDQEILKESESQIIESNQILEQNNGTEKQIIDEHEAILSENIIQNELINVQSETHNLHLGSQDHEVEKANIQTENECERSEVEQLIECHKQDQEQIEVSNESAPAPDIVSEHSRSELITDIDIGIPESRAQEICVPVTSEIHNDVEEIRPATTPPPTPAVEPSAEPPLTDIPIAAPVEPAAALLAGAAAATAAVAATAAATSKPKVSPAKKSPTTPTPRPKSAAPKAPTPAKTPVSATKRPTSTTTTPKPPAAKPATPRTTPLSASAKTAKPSTKPASPTKAAPKPPAPAKEPLATTKAAPARTKSAPVPTARPAPKPAAPKPPTTKPTTATTKPTTALSKPSTAKPAPRPIPPKTSAPVPAKSTVAAKSTLSSTAKPAGPSAPKPAVSATAKPKAPEKKPLMNGDVKPAAKPAPRPAASARPAPRAPTRPPAPPATKTATAKPAAKAPLDKQTKDLANKRITAKAAPPRTAPAKPTAGSKTAVKSVPKKEVITNGVEMSKSPPSPPLDNALPDVIA